jgi:hypothetical protein
MSDILEKLRGGDLRSIGRSNEVAREVESDPSIFESIFIGLFNSDPVVRMRSADVIEKVTQSKPMLLFGYTEKVNINIEGCRTTGGLLAYGSNSSAP